MTLTHAMAAVLGAPRAPEKTSVEHDLGSLAYAGIPRRAIVGSAGIAVAVE